MPGAPEAVIPGGPRRIRAGGVAALVLSLALAIVSLVTLNALTESSGTAVGNGSPRALPPGQPSSQPLPSQRRQFTDIPVATGVPAGSQPIPERPRGLVLPSGTRVALKPAVTRKDGHLDVPTAISTGGWWDGGARLGDPFGALLIAAHVDSTTQGLGPFAQLLSVRAGEHVTLMSRHLRAGFDITTIEVIPKGSLPDRTDLFTAAGPLRLVLITCSGPFDPGAGGYQNLTVVTAEPSGQVGRRR